MTWTIFRVFNALFDVMNSRNLLAKGYKSPLRQENFHHWMPLLVEASDYIKTLQKTDHTLLIESQLKTGFIGFVGGIEAMRLLFEDLVVKGPLDFVLTYKMSQDHLELYFAAVRSRLGANNNPSCKQFSAIVKRLLVHSEICGKHGNANAIDATNLLTMSSVQKLVPLGDILSLRRSENSKIEVDIPFEANSLELASVLNTLSEYKKSVIVYIAGYVVKMIQKIVKCEDCLAALSVSTTEMCPNQQLLKRKAWGRLTFASQDVINVCYETERLLSKLLIESQGKAPNQKFLVQKISTWVVKSLFSKLR